MFLMVSLEEITDFNLFEATEKMLDEAISRLKLLPPGIISPNCRELKAMTYWLTGLAEHPEEYVNHPTEMYLSYLEKK